MKLALVALAAASVAYAQTAADPYTECMTRCANNVTTTTRGSYGPPCAQGLQWNDNACLCNGDFQQQVKICLYQAGCNTEVPVWFEKARDACSAASISVSASGSGYGRGGSNGPNNTAAASAAASSASPTASGGASPSASNSGASPKAVIPVGLALIAGAALLI